MITVFQPLGWTCPLNIDSGPVNASVAHLRQAIGRPASEAELRPVASMKPGKAICIPRCFEFPTVFATRSFRSERLDVRGANSLEFSAQASSSSRMLSSFCRFT